MKVREVMSAKPEYLDVEASIREAALRMKETGRGFTPIADNDRLVGVITDRDLAVRALGEGLSPDQKVGDIETGAVLYCFEDDNVRDVLQNMHDQQVQRLLVLNNEQGKDLSGVVAISDIADKCEDDDLARRIAHCCRHYH